MFPALFKLIYTQYIWSYIACSFVDCANMIPYFSEVHSGNESHYFLFSPPFRGSNGAHASLSFLMFTSMTFPGLHIFAGRMTPSIRNRVTGDICVMQECDCNLQLCLVRKFTSLPQFFLTATHAWWVLMCLLKMHLLCYFVRSIYVDLYSCFSSGKMPLDLYTFLQMSSQILCK